MLALAESGIKAVLPGLSAWIKDLNGPPRVEHSIGCRAGDQEMNDSKVQLLDTRYLLVSVQGCAALPMSLSPSMYI